MKTMMNTSLTLAALATLCFMTVGCGNTTNQTDVDCGAGRTLISDSGEVVCAYRKDLIEEGFQCPADVNFQIPFENGMVCSAQNMLPDVFRQDLMDLSFGQQVPPQTNNMNTNNMNTNNTNMGGIPKCPDPLVSDGFQLISATISGDTLSADVAYSGGCAEHEFKLCWSGAIAKSLPPQTDVYITHNGNGDVCEAFPMETITFDIKPLRDAAGSGNKIIVHVNAANANSSGQPQKETVDYSW